jgi:hypothetical protein
MEIDGVKIMVMEEVKSSKPYTASTYDFAYDNVLIRNGENFTLFKSNPAFDEMLKTNFPSSSIKGLVVTFDDDDLMMFMLRIEQSVNLNKA